MRRTIITCFTPASACRAPLLAAISAALCLAGLLILAPPAAAASLAGVSWTTSKSTTGAMTASYSYRFTIATASSLTSVTMTVPTSTGGSPTVGAVTPAAISGGTVVLAGTTLTYSFTAASVSAGQAVSIQVNGITNTTTAGTYTAAISTRTGGTSVDTGTSGNVTFTGAALTSPTWSVSSAVTGATGVSYTYGFSSLLAILTTLTMTVPPGTSGIPTIGTTSGITLGTVTLSGTTLTLSVLSISIGPVSIQINGLTNTATAGSYPSEIVASTASGITPAVTFTGGLTLTSPSALGWSGTITGSAQNLVDGTAGQQNFLIDDETGSGAGWHITASATTFTTGLNSLPNSGSLVFTGSVTAATATTGPSVACNTSCTLPVNTTTYPVAITTAATSPTAATVFDTAAGSGLGPAIIGGSSAANPVGWWIKLLATARAGTYSSTITIATVSGP
jgi:hypothetical protein